MAEQDIGTGKDTFDVIMVFTPFLNDTWWLAYKREVLYVKYVPRSLIVAKTTVSLHGVRTINLATYRRGTFGGLKSFSFVLEYVGYFHLN